MTPERAKELANQYWDEWMNSPSNDRLADALTSAILAACKEQKEQDAKICESLFDRGDIDNYPVAEDCAKAIRGGA